MQRGLAILSEFEKEAERLGVREIARRLELNPATTQRLVNTLLDAGFLARDSDANGYVLGYKALSLGATQLNSNRLVSSSMEILQGLAKAAQVNTFLGTLLGDKVIYLLSIQSQGPIAINSKFGQPLALHSSALGKVILSQVSDSQFEALIHANPLERFTENTITDMAVLREELARVRSQNYAIVCGENLTGINSVGALVRGANGQVAAAISGAYAPTLQPQIVLEDLTRQVVEAAIAISRKLGCPTEALPQSETVPL